MENPHDSGLTPAYVLGHSDRELDRLRSQARLIDPITRQIFSAAGIVPGMRVLDVGSGAGDVAFLAAEMVGDAGEVVGVERVPAALTAARARAEGRGLRNVFFREGDPAEMVFERPFDAVIGRYVLMFQRDPAAMLRKLAMHVRPGGVVVFHETDWDGVRSSPPVPTYDRCCRWIVETFRLHGTESQMGIKLYSTFLTAGLPAPSMQLTALVSGGAQSASYVQLIADLAGTLLPEMERLGVATAAEVGVDTLVERIRDEAIARGSVMIGFLNIGAWSRVQPATPA
jgi:ubiquinone/menaquinone biosynthesis C-methylase UbiE